MIEPVDLEEVMGGTIEDTKSAQTTINSCFTDPGIMTPLDSLGDTVSNASMMYTETKEVCETDKNEIDSWNKEHPDDQIDSEEVAREDDENAKSMASNAAESGKGAANKRINSLKGMIKTQVAAFMDQAKSLVTSIPVQLGVISANPYTTASVPIVTLQILATITALLCAASTIISMALLINLPLPKAFTEMINKLGGLKAMLGGAAAMAAATGAIAAAANEMEQAKNEAQSAEEQAQAAKKSEESSEDSGE